MKKNKNSDIDIQYDLEGKTQIIINGQDISNFVTQVCVIMNTGEIPRVELGLLGNIKITGKGEIIPFKEE